MATNPHRPPAPTAPPEPSGVGSRSGRSETWSDVLDSLAAQIDLQERCVRLGHAPPPDLEIGEPDGPLVGNDLLRAIELFERCEALALEAARSLASTRRAVPSAYAGSALSVTSTRPASFA